MGLHTVFTAGMDAGGTVRTKGVHPHPGHSNRGRKREARVSEAVALVPLSKRMESARLRFYSRDASRIENRAKSRHASCLKGQADLLDDASPRDHEHGFRLVPVCQIPRDGQHVLSAVDTRVDNHSVRIQSLHIVQHALPVRLHWGARRPEDSQGWTIRGGYEG